MDEVSKFTEITDKIRSLSDRKIRLEERYDSEKSKLEKLIAEITAKGYDPKNLVSIKEQKESELRGKLEELQNKIAEISKALDSIEAA